MRAKQSSGLTLLELFVVLVILGILAAMAAPHFGRAMERARVRDAEAVLVSIYNAERMYRLDQASFGTLANLTNNRYLTDPDAGDSNENWNFWDPATDFATATTFQVTAIRTGGGGYNENTITVNQGFTGANYGGNHPLRGE